MFRNRHFLRWGLICTPFDNPLVDGHCFVTERGLHPPFALAAPGSFHIHPVVILQMEQVGGMELAAVEAQILRLRRLGLRP